MYPLRLEKITVKAGLDEIPLFALVTTCMYQQETARTFCGPISSHQFLSHQRLLSVYSQTHCWIDCDTVLYLKVSFGKVKINVDIDPYYFVP